MCSVFGSIGSYKKELSEEAFETLSHRGPDNQRIIYGDDYFLASHRLAITAENESFKKDDIYIALNGEIYNHLQVRKKIAANFTTQTELETLYYAYKKWGIEFVEHIEGMFVIVVYELKLKKLLIFRDKIGKKPLYYYHKNNTLTFASEIKAIRKYHKDITEDKDAVMDYLCYQTTLSPYTFYKDILLLEAGYYLSFYKQELMLYSYVKDTKVPSIIMDESQAKLLLESTLIQSLGKRLPKEQSPLFFLSGGLDSSLLCAMAQSLQDKPIETFTIGYEGAEKYDESGYAKEVSDYIGAKNEKVIYTFDDFKRGLKDIYTMMDEPLNDPALFPLSHLFRHVKREQNSKVIISGEGADELFLGYRPYKEFLDIEKLSALENKNWLKNFFLKHESEHREWEWYRRVLESELLFRSSAESFTHKQANALLHKRNPSQRAYKQIIKHHEDFKRQGDSNPLSWYRYCDLKIHQGDYFLKKLDRVSMYHSLEARTPYLDENLIQTVSFMDVKLNIKNGVSKYLLKEVARKYLPKNIIERKKRGFSYPFISWLDKAGGFKEMLQLNDKHQVFKAKALKTLLESASKGVFKQHIFGIYLLLKYKDEI